MLCWTAQGGYGRLAVCGVADVTLDIEKAPLDVPLVQPAEIAGVSGSAVLASKLGVASEGFSLHCAAAMNELKNNTAKANALVARKAIQPSRNGMREPMLVGSAVLRKTAGCRTGADSELLRTQPRNGGLESCSMERQLERTLVIHA